MNKKLNTLLFWVAATVVNMVLALVIFLVVLVAYLKTLSPLAPNWLNALVLVGLLFLSLAASFPIYRRLVHMLQAKIDFEKYFDPIIFRGPKTRR